METCSAGDQVLQANPLQLRWWYRGKHIMVTWSYMTCSRLMMMRRGLQRWHSWRGFLVQHVLNGWKASSSWSFGARFCTKFPVSSLENSRSQVLRRLVTKYRRCPRMLPCEASRAILPHGFVLAASDWGLRSLGVYILLILMRARTILENPSHK